MEITTSNATFVLTEFLGTFFAVHHFASIILVYESSTSSLATTILTSTVPPLLRMAIINIDTIYRYPAPTAGPHKIFCADDDCLRLPNHEHVFKDPESFVISVFDWHDPGEKLLASRKRFPLSERCSNFVILSGPNETFIDSTRSSYIDALMPALAALRLVNVASVDWQQRGIELLRLRYDYGDAIPIAISDASSVQAQAFYDKTLDMRGREIVLFGLFEPLRMINQTSFTEHGVERLNVGGSDAYFGSLLDGLLHTKSTFYTWDASESNVRQMDSNTLSVFNEFVRKAYVEDNRQQPNCLEYVSVIKNEEECFLQNRSLIILNAQFELNAGDIPLYPHEYENFVIVVPSILQSSTSLLKTLQGSPLVKIWMFAIAIFSISRKALRTLMCSNSKGFDEICFNTLGMSFSATGQTPRRGSAADTNRPERVLVLFLSIFAMLASILFSGSLYQQITTTVTRPAINSLEDLNLHLELEVWVLSDLQSSTEQWLQKRVNNKIRRAKKWHLLGMIFAKNTSSAYVIPESRSQLMRFHPELKKMFHIIPNKLLGQHLFFSVKEWWWLSRLNVILQHAKQHGLYKYFLARTARTMKIKGSLSTTRRLGEKSLQNVSFSEMRGVFSMYSIGIIIAILAFGGEHLYHRLKYAV